MRKWGVRVCILLLGLLALKAAVIGVPIYLVRAVIAREALDDAAIDVATFLRDLAAAWLDMWRDPIGPDTGDDSGA